MAPRARAFQEVCWLAAACMVPLVFNPRGPELGYQPFKIGLWILLLSAGLVAWVIEASLTHVPGGRHGSGRLRWFLLMLAASAASVLVSTTFSIDPFTSLGGLPETFQGAWAQWAMLATAAFVMCRLRGNAASRRLIWAIILAGSAAAGFAILQRNGWDPVRPELKGVRCPGPAGHPVYLGGFLAMVMPLTLWRMREGFMRAGAFKWLDGILCAGLVLVQVAGAYCAESRGSMVAMAAGVLALVVFSAAWWRSGRLLLITAVCTVLVSILAGLVASGTLRNSSLATLPVFRRFAEIQEIGQGLEEYRSETWRLMPGIMTEDAAVPKPSGGEDGLKSWRLLIGHGPETLSEVLPTHRAWHATDRQENRLHNLLWDRFQSQGIIGLACLTGLWLLVFHTVFRHLGWISGLREGVVFAVSCISGAILGAVVAGSLVHWGFAALGGMLGSAFVVLTTACLRGFTRCKCGKGAPQAGLMIACAAALIAHWVDMGTSFPTGATAVVFWLLVGWIAAGVNQPPEDESAGSDESGFPLMEGVLLTLAVVTLLCSSIHQFSYDPMSVTEVLRLSLWNAESSGEPASRMALLPLLLAIWCGLLPADAGCRRRRSRFLVLVLPSLIVAACYAVMQAEAIRRIGPIPSAGSTDGTAVRQAQGYLGLWIGFSSFAGLMLLAAAVGSPRTADLAAIGFRRPRVFIAPAAAAAIAVFLTWMAVAKPVAANVTSQWGDALAKLGRPNQALEVLRMAVDFDKDTFAYRGMLAAALLDAAPDQGTADKKRAMLEEVGMVLEDSKSRSDFNRRHFFLGRAYLQKGLDEPKPTRKATAANAVGAFARALRHEPFQEEVWTYASLADRFLADNPAEADRKLAKALELAAGFSDVAATRYTQTALSQADPILKGEFSRIAILHHDRTISTGSGTEVARASMEKAKLLLAKPGNAEEARKLLLAATGTDSPEISWQAHALLAELFAGKGDQQSAIRHLKSALQAAPAEKKDRIREILKALGGGD